MNSRKKDCNMAKRELTARYLFFIAGLFVNAFGISLIIKANLGSSPISSLPYTSSNFPVTLGASPRLPRAGGAHSRTNMASEKGLQKRAVSTNSRSNTLQFLHRLLDGIIGRIHSCGLCFADSITDNWLCDTWPGSKYEVVANVVCASREIAHTIVITIKMNDFILNIYLVCYIINEVMQRNVLPQHKIACFFVSMSNGSTKVEFKLYMRVAYLNLTT